MSRFVRPGRRFRIITEVLHHYYASGDYRVRLACGHERSTDLATIGARRRCVSCERADERSEQEATAP